MKDSTLVHTRVTGENPGDTLQDTTTILSIYGSDSLLFVYKYEYRAQNGVTDGDYTEWFYFIMPGGTGDFIVPASPPIGAKMFYRRSCTGDCGVRPVEGGTLTGRMTGYTYAVEGVISYVEFKAPESGGQASIIRGLQFSGIFQPSSTPPEI